MAVIKLGALATSITGKVGGQVFQGGNFGTILKNNRFKRSRQTQINYKRRSVFSRLAQEARALTTAQRATCAANGLLFTRPTKQGSATPYDWFSWYMAFNANRALLGVGSISTAVTPATPVNWDSFEIDHTEGTANWLASGVDSYDSTWSYVIEAGPMCGAYDRFKPSAMRVIQVGTCASDDISILGGNYTNVFGATASGRFVWFRVSFIKTATGERCKPKITKADAQ